MTNVSLPQNFFYVNKGICSVVMNKLPKEWLNYENNKSPCKIKENLIPNQCPNQIQ